MDHISATAVFSALTIIVGGVCIMLIVSTKTLRDSRDDQEKRIDFLEAKSARDDATIAGQAGQLDALGKVVTGEVHLVAIIDLLTEHHTEAVRNWKHVGTTLDHVDATQGQLLAAFKERP